MNAKELGRYYTPAWAARALIDRVLTTPKTVLDLCCGGGALAIAAAARWQLDELVTVDVDPTVATKSFANLAISAEHMQTDALDIGLSSKLSERRFDLVLCNPPFGRRRSGTGRLVVASAKLGEVGSWPAAEMIGLAQAIRMTLPGGTVAAVMPDTFATGRLAKRFRTHITAHHNIVSITELPGRTFANTDAKAYLMVIIVGGSRQKTKLERLGQYGTVEAESFVEPETCIDRMDLASRTPDPSTSTSLASLGVTVARGRLNSVAARDCARPCFHTSDFSASENGAVRLSGHPDTVASLATTVLARPGDILVARVDRRLEEKVVIVSEGSAEITDCVFRVRSAPGDRERIWTSLRSPEGKASLARAARGVGPRHLAMLDLLAIHV